MFNPFSDQEKAPTGEEEEEEEEGAIKVEKEKIKEELEMQDVREQVKEDFIEDVEDRDRLSEEEEKIMKRSGNYLIDKFTIREGEEIDKEEAIKRFGESFRKGLLDKLPPSVKPTEKDFNKEEVDKAEGYYKGKFVRDLSNPEAGFHGVFDDLEKVAVLESSLPHNKFDSMTEMMQENEDKPKTERKMEELVEENLDLIHYRMGVEKERSKKKQLEEIGEGHPDKEKAAEAFSSPDSEVGTGRWFKKKLKERGFEVKREEEVRFENKEGESETETTNEILAKDDERVGTMKFEFERGREDMQEIYEEQEKQEE